MEHLLNTGVIVRRDIEQIYKGLYIDAVCSFENFLEDLFIGLLVGRYTPSSRHIVPRVKFTSPIIARDVILSGKRYVDWLPYNLTMERAKAFFRNGRPFTTLTPTDRQLTEQICIIRNALAHDSEYANKIFEKKIVNSMALAPRDRNPSGYLRSEFRIAPVQTRFENLTIEMSGIARKLCTY